jgi:adenine-specific DNA-methyltransferase
LARKKEKPIIDVEKLREIETYDHKDKKRSNNPPVGMAHYDTVEEKQKKYEFDPHLDPTLQWAGKAEGTSFNVPTSSIHIHESIKPHKIIKSVQTIDDSEAPLQLSLFDNPIDRMKLRREAIEFYQHGKDWTNRMIAGDSLAIMNSLLEKEGMAGQVQMVYIDPPYGIKYGSNFQPFVNKRDVKDGKDEDLSQEPEMIKAFRDTWELGIHSYLTYLRNRLLLVRELLTESGSVFIQIGDENLHFVRNICDEIFGAENFQALITFRKTSITFATEKLGGVCDYVIWYAKNNSKKKYNTLFIEKVIGGIGATNYGFVELPNGERRRLTAEEKANPSILPQGARVFSTENLVSSGTTDSCVYDFEFEGRVYKPLKGKSWKTNLSGMQRLIEKNRLVVLGEDRPYFITYFDEYPITKLTNAWYDTRGEMDLKYVVQTANIIIQRCMLMSTDPGDLVLDITCGSGTTAYVAEQWGRRWITCDTSRVAIALAKQRLMTAVFDYYKLAHEKQGVGSGFIYKTVPHITLGSIANNEPPATETLYDKPEIDKTKVRITGPFTVEALPSPVVKPLDDIGVPNDSTAKHIDWKDELLATGILGRNGAKIEFSRVETLPGTKFLHAEAETIESEPRRAVICFAGETKPLDSRMVSLALDEVENLRPRPKLVIFAAFQFDPEAAKVIDETKWPGITLLKVQMNTDLMTDDLKKKRSSNQSFWLVGQPDVELIRLEKGRDKGKYKVKVNGFDYYDVKTGTVISGNANRIAMWMLDTNYDGMCIEPMQVFFPMGGKTDGWNKLAKTLKAEIDQDLIEKYSGNESLSFTVSFGTQIAVKIIDDRGIESLKVIKVGEQ